MLSSTTRTMIVGLLVALLSLAACGEDDTGGNNANNGNNGQGQDAGGQDVSDTTGGGDTSSDDASDDTTTEDDAQDDTSTQDTVEDTAEDATGEDAVDDATSDDAMDTMQDDVDTRGACGAGSDQTCAYPAGASTCSQGPWGAGSFISTFEIQEDGDCCYDFDNDGSNDSGIERLDTLLESAAGFTFNELIRIQIESGGLSYLVTYSDWSNPVNDPESQMDIVFGNSTSTFTEKQNGNGVFTVTAASLDANGDPISDLQPMDVCDSHVTVRGGSAPLKVPIGSNLVTLNLNDVRLDADVVAPTDLSAGGKVGLSNGELGGWVTVDEVFGALNTISQTCPCLQKDVFEKSGGAWSCTADSTDQSNCTGAAQVCDEFVSEPAICGLAAQTISSQADYDALPEGNPDGSLDSFTVGAKFTATGAELSGTSQ